jgi:pyridoxine kinase
LNILSIQSWVAYGHVGNASAVFPLQRLGAEVWAVNTVQFSNHTGYGDWTGQVFTGAQVSSLVDGIAARGALERCDAVLSGYMGDAGIGAAIVDAVARVKAANPAALYCCDPVLGDDDTGLYVRAGIDVFMRDVALRVADIATPNRFELEHLSGLPTRTLAQTKIAIAALQAMGPRIVLVTSVQVEETPQGCIDMLAAEGDVVHLLRTPALPVHVNGAGDAIAALFLFHCLRTGDVAQALALAGSSIWGLLRRTAEAGSREILTVAAQDEFVQPSRIFDTFPC